MKNKKGFTLVELIAVIALLAVILLLIVPNVVNILKEGREDAFVNQVQSVMRAAEKQYGTDLAFKNASHLYCSGDDIFALNFNATNSIARVENNYDKILATTIGMNTDTYMNLSDCSENGKIVALGVQDKNYCYISSDPTLDIDKNDFVKGELVCEDGACSCGGDDFFYLRIRVVDENSPLPFVIPQP